jgi:hypothetical protein
MWPDLPEKGFIKGRAATLDDIASNNAAFVLQSNGVPVGIPLPIEIPQYAMHIDVDTGRRTPGIIVQAEVDGPRKVVALCTIPDNGIIVAMLSECELLGTERPKE